MISFKSLSIRTRLFLAFGGMLGFILIIAAYSAAAIMGNTIGSVSTLAAMTGVAVVFGLLLMFSLIGSIVKPLKFLTEVAHGVSQGDLNIHLKTDDKDEIGIFKNSFGKMISTINELTEDIEFMAVAQSEGVSVINIDSKKYYGKYGEISALVNDMISEQHDITNSAINTIYKIAGGDFEAQTRTFPGDKIILNRTIDALRENLSSVHNEISRLAQSAAIGDLTNRAESSRFTGDWSKLMSDINSLLIAFTTPMNETISVLEQIANGDFTAKMCGDYQGDYHKIQESVNLMVVNIGGYIKEITQILEALSAKDFTVGIEREYIGDFNFLKVSINKIVKDLNEIFTNFRSVANQLNIGAKVVSDSSMTLAIGVQDQTDAMNNLLNVLTDVKQVSVSNSANAENASKLSNTANEYTRLGVEEMEKLLAAMDDIKKSSQSISSIIKTTEDIAFQINLLSINASIEAASAGEYGRGFAIVAQEVRGLANKSRSIADEVAKSITASSEKIMIGSEFVKTATDTLQSISTQISSASEIVSDIADISRDQVDKISIVHADTSKLSSMTNQNFDTPHQFAATAEELSSQAEVLNEALAKFQLKKMPV